MSALEILPAIDLRGGQLVRLEQGDYGRETVYDTDPASVARRFAEQGASRIHVVDLDGARAGEPRNLAAVEAIVRAAGSVPVQLGGGIRTIEVLQKLYDLGVDRAILGTVALRDPDLLRRAATRYPGRVVLGLDARDGRVATEGWLETANEHTEQVLARFEDLPLAAVVHTDIARDGMLAGPNVDATESLARATRIPVIASGGVSGIADLTRLAAGGVVAGAIVGKAIYTGAIDLAEAIAEVRAC